MAMSIVHSTPHLDYCFFAASLAALINGVRVLSGSEILKNGCCWSEEDPEGLVRWEESKSQHHQRRTCNSFTASGLFVASTSRQVLSHDLNRGLSDSGLFILGVPVVAMR